MTGYPFTWEKWKGTPNWIEERLDKVLANQSWRENVPDASVQNILTRKSDHSVLFLGILNLREMTGGLKRGFRFEMAWLHDEGCRDVVEKAWNEGEGRGLQECISLCGNRLTRWGGERFHKFGERMRNLRKEQLRLRGCNDPVSLAEFQRLEECLSRIEAQEDTYWRQRAKQHWLKNADANTKYYHSVNGTNIILIPKKKSPEVVSDYRPIALSNVIYRIMAKVIAARMKPLMGDIISDTQSAFISDTQSAFISDRLITDNILIAAEVGGTRSEQISPTRGLRQVDPLSPYLFIICAEGLSLLLQQEAGVVKQCLSVYEEMSGQAVNYYKSSICYSKNTRDDDREEVASTLGVVQAPNFGKYLGLPSFVGRNKRAVFSYIDDKIRQRIGSWNKKLLSQAAIERTMNRYWWRSKDDQGIHWKAWDKLCIPKKYRGLGFKELHAFNLAMLGKQAWRLLTKPESLVSRIFKARYYPKGSFFDACIGNNPSFCWRSIMAAQEVICGGVMRRIGDGKATLIWDHPWLQDENNAKIITEKPPHLAQATVMGLMDQETGSWDHDILTDIFITEDVT
ncbi:PREDICTED: uncharacterized protein LOC109162458 [Ipomoea nil]|uniref:uncharacterized protein LOC109162458 n=1 Tax=Ipomoea nil TaxID=35883 RepID=UPI0009016C64|nr:PREDICTED: uncharacterized protein LOC109162458 [Ipomoea nil]